MLTKGERHAVQQLKQLAFQVTEDSRKNARKERIKTNRKRACRACETPIAIAS